MSDRTDPAAHQSQPARAWRENVNLPTYVPPPPDPNPMFLDKRVNQGTSGRVYPSPITDRLAAARQDRAYDAIFLENEHIQLMVLPQIGGRVHAALDKSNGYDFIYRQHAIKPAMIGLFGPWVSGGMEFDWPQHHRPSTFMPVDSCIEQHADGSVTAWLSEHEPMERTKGVVGIRLSPGQARFQTITRLYNRMELPQSFLWWVNVGIHVNEQYQLVFPPDVTYAVDHSRRNSCHFPKAGEPYYEYPFSGQDISWCKNIPISSSFFAGPSQYDFFGGYDHGRSAGIIHVADHHISPGKKLFTWGTCDFSHAWHEMLTDGDGPYVELMAGVYTDNQPDFSWLAPYETRTFTQFWYPVRDIGAAKNANRLLAVNLEVDGGKAKVGVLATEPIGGAVIRLTAGDAVLLEHRADLTPARAWLGDANLRGAASEYDLLLTVSSCDGRELIRYAPKRVAQGTLPPNAKVLGSPQSIATNDELYLAGLHTTQYRHPTLEPDIYWREAIRRDPGDSRSHNALGQCLLKRGFLAQAEQHFRGALERLTAHNFNPYDGEALYGLGLALWHQGRVDEAYDAFYKATWNYAQQAAAHLWLARIDCSRGRFEAALEHLDRSLAVGQDNLQARTLESAVLRRLARVQEARQFAQQTTLLDRLDFGARFELALAARADGRAAEADSLLDELAGLMRGNPQTHIDIALEYAAAGLWDEAAAMLQLWRDGLADDAGDNPMVVYALGYLAFQQGRRDDAMQLYRRAAELPTQYVFPSRLDEMTVLRHALSVCSEDASACYYLGNLLYDKGHFDEAIECWQRCVALRPGLAGAWRNLGIAAFNIQHRPAEAWQHYQKAFAINPADARLLSEMNELAKRVGRSPAQRLAMLQQHAGLVAMRDDLSVEMVTLHNLLGQYDKALAYLLSRQFHPWEGGTGKAPAQYAAARIALGRDALQAGRAAEALEHFQAAAQYPKNINEGRHLLASHAHIHYYTALAQQALGHKDAAGQSLNLTARSQFELVPDAPMPPVGLTVASYYQAVAMKALGDSAAARQRLEELMAIALKARDEADQPGFATSTPRLTVFEDDAAVLRRADCTFLIGMAHLGLGRREQAREALGEVLRINVNHLEATEELRRLDAETE